MTRVVPMLARMSLSQHRSISWAGALVLLIAVTLGLAVPAQAQALRTLDNGDPVWSVVFSPDGRTVLSVSAEPKLKLWDVASGSLIRTFEGHTDTDESVAFAPDGRTALSGSFNTPNLWDVASGQLTHTFKGRTKFGGSTSVAFAPDGRTALSGGLAGPLKLWDVAGGRLIRTFEGHEYGFTSIAFAPDGRTAVSGDYGDYALKLWDVANGRLIRTFEGHADAVYSVAFSPDGRTVLSGSRDKTAKLWDVASGRLIRTLEGHTDTVHSVAFSPDGRTALSGSDDKTLKLWDVASGRLIRSFEEHSKRVNSVAFSPDGRTAVSGSSDGTLKFWDLRQGADTPVASAVPAIAPALPAPPPLQAPPLAALPSETPPPTPVLPAPQVAAVVAVSPPPLAAPPTLPPAGRRVALIVANGAYQGAPLANPTIDAGLVAESLKQDGFDVTVKTDVDLDAFEQAITQFADTAKGADLALFYFAGHGFSVASGGIQQNLLMATSANFQAKTTLALMGGGEPLDHVEETLIGHARATLIFVDACRNIPTLASRGVGGRGFARIDTDALDGAYVVLSTRQGQTAEDGDGGQGSPFARAFAAALPVPGLRIEDAFARMREQVRKETDGAQVPDVIRSDLPEGGVVLMGQAAH